MKQSIEPMVNFDPDVAAYLERSRSTGRPNFEEMSVEQAREAYRASRHTLGLPAIGGVDIVNDTVAGRTCSIPVRRYLPLGEARGTAPAILFLHGGGWVIGDLDTHDAICRHVAVATGLQVVSVDYRLAPEHPCPAAIEDAIDAHVMLLNRAREWSIDTRRIVLMGDSAGGALAFATALNARDMCRPMPAAQVLFYPVCDLTGNTASHTSIRDVPITGRTIAWFKSHYCKSDADALDWRNSPALVKNLAGLGPTFLTVAEHDPLRDEALSFEKRLRANGCDIHLRYLPGQVHGYLTLGGLIAEARHSIAAAADFLRTCLN